MIANNIHININKIYYINVYLIWSFLKQIYQKYKINIFLFYYMDVKDKKIIITYKDHKYSIIFLVYANLLYNIINS